MIVIGGGIAGLDCGPRPAQGWASPCSFSRHGTASADEPGTGRSPAPTSRSRSAARGSSSATSRTSRPRSQRYGLSVAQSPTGQVLPLGRRRTASPGYRARAARGGVDFERGSLRGDRAAHGASSSATPLDTQPLADLDVSFSDVPRAARSRALDARVPLRLGRLLLRLPSVGGVGAPRPLLGGRVRVTARGRGTRRSRTSSGRAPRASSTRSPRTAAPRSGCRRRSPAIEQESDGVTVTTRYGESSPGQPWCVAAPLNTWHDIEFSPALSEPKRQAASEGQTGHSTKVWALVENAAGPPRRRRLGRRAQLGLDRVRAPGGTACWSASARAPSCSTSRAGRHPPCDSSSSSPGARVVATDAHDWNADEFSQGRGWPTARAS